MHSWKIIVIILLATAHVRMESSEVADVAKTLRAFLKVFGKPGYVTCMTCWKKDLTFRLYTHFHDFAHQSPDYADHEIALVSALQENIPETSEGFLEIVVLDIQCQNSVDVLLQLGERQTNHVWILIDLRTEEDSTNMTFSALNKLPLSPSSEVYYIKKTGSGNAEYSVESIYRTEFRAPLIIEGFGFVINGSFIDSRSSPIISRRRQDLRGLELRASMVLTNNDTLNHLTDYREIQTDPLSKVNYKLTEFLMSYLNASASYLIVSTWGYRNSTTQEWGGMVGQLVRNEAELGATPLFMTIDRISFIQYIASPTPTGSRFVFRSPKLSFTNNVFLLPFDDLVWCCLIILVLITAVFLICSIFIEWKYLSINESDSSALRPSIGDVFFVVFGATCQQGSAVTPRSATARIIMVITFTILMFLYTSYSANIVALLQSSSMKIKTLKDLYDSRMEIGVDDTVFNHYYFSNSEGIRKKIYDDKVKRKNGQENFMSLDEGVKRLRKGLFAFHMELALGYKLISETFFEDEKCGLVEIPYLQVTEPWYAVKKNSSYTELFKIGLMRMHEHGLQDRENNRLYTKKPRCAGHTGNFITASLVDIKPALLMLLCGIILSLSLFFIELIMARSEQCYRVFQRFQNT